MPLYIVRNDITKMKVDAIVNAANSSLLGGGGVDGCIHRAAGPELLEECSKLGGCPTGSAKITGAGKLPCRYVIHAVGPRWFGGMDNERGKLISCYDTSLKLAKEYGCESIAFPLISSGIFGYPKDQALRIAVERISAFLMQNDMTVYIVIFDKNAYQISKKVFADIQEYVDDRYVEEHTDDHIRQRHRLHMLKECSRYEENCMPLSHSIPLDTMPMYSMPSIAAQAKPVADKTEGISLDEALKHIDESFSEMLLRKIDEAGITDAECYKKANIDRKLFSKIRLDKHYKPSKPTAIAFAVALELSLEETREMLQKAGFALSHSNKFDIIIEYFIENKNYDIFQINEALFAFDQNLLGA